MTGTAETVATIEGWKAEAEAAASWLRGTQQQVKRAEADAYARVLALLLNDGSE